MNRHFIVSTFCATELGPFVIDLESGEFMLEQLFPNLHSIVSKGYDMTVPLLDAFEFEQSRRSHFLKNVLKQRIMIGVVYFLQCLCTQFRRHMQLIRKK